MPTPDQGAPANLDLTLIGNCSFGGLLDKQARLVWACLPQFDSDPIFCHLLGGPEHDGGFFDVVLDGCNRTEQHYERNSAVVVTTLRSESGAAIHRLLTA